MTLFWQLLALGGSSEVGPWIVVYGLATWRLSSLLVHERGPWDVFVRLRQRFGVGHDEFGVPSSWPDGSILACIWCTSLWVAGAALIAMPIAVALWLAVGAVAVIVHSYESRR